MRKTRVLFEQVVADKAQRLLNKVKVKADLKKKAKEDEKKKGFEKFYEMSYNELRQAAKKLNVKTWRKTKEDLIEELIAEHKRLH
jgi:hypothetical protein